MVEVAHRCLHARHLLTPSGELNELALGVIAKAQQLFEVTLYLAAVMSNHLHLLFWADDAEHMAKFMNYVASNLAREANRLYGWKGKFWDGPYTPVVVATDEETLVSRLRYFLEQGCKENLVARPRDWPGIHPAKMLLSTRHRTGVWVDRSALYRARLNARARKRSHRRQVRAVDFEETLVVELSPLPCWAHLTPEEYLRRVRREIASIEAETAERHRRDGTRPLGRRAILRQDPHYRPPHAKRSRPPLIHSVSRAVRKAYEEAYRLLVSAYREASARLRAGQLDVAFPEGTFPPGRPFVPYTAEPRAG